MKEGVKKRVMVGLSGGVDSAVTAALLQKEGYDVTGVFIKGWYPPGLPCTWAKDRRDAMRVAAHLSIPFYTLDAGDAYKKSVIDYLIREYKEGRTPNPDSMCNRDVKFGVFYEYATSKGFEYIATGHYARVEHTEEGARLYRGIDPDKDQTYFLWAVPRTVFEKTLFPLGVYKKSDVRTLAHHFKLPVAEKKDSQGICFLGPVSIDEFLRNKFPVTKGTAYDQKGTMIGKHDGAVLYTLGERVGLADAPPGPWFVIRKDIETNMLVVAKDVSTIQQEHPLHIHAENWLRTPSSSVTVQYRYHGPKVAGTYDEKKSTFLPTTPLREPVAEGQSLVFYTGDECIGGGIIGL